MMAEVGVILLMFSVGIEFSVPDLLRVKWVALIGAPVGISLSIGLGVGVGILLGWPLSQRRRRRLYHLRCQHHGSHAPSHGSRRTRLRSRPRHGHSHAGRRSRCRYSYGAASRPRFFQRCGLCPGLLENRQSSALTCSGCRRRLENRSSGCSLAWKKPATTRLSLLLALTICLVVAAITEALACRSRWVRLSVACFSATPITPTNSPRKRFPFEMPSLPSSSSPSAC